jgi:hypothetical protein
MTIEYAPVLRIDFKIDTQCEISFTRRQDREPAIIVRNNSFSVANLSELRQEVRDILRQLIAPMGTQSVLPLRQALSAMAKLRRDMKFILIKLFGEAVRKQLPAAINLCNDLCLGWDKPGWDGNSILPNLIVVTAPVGHGIPIDLLPLFDVSSSEAGTTMTDLARLASSFIGFSTIVKREVGSPIPTSTNLENIPRLPLKMFINRSLNGAVREEAYLSKSVHLDVEQSWPDASAPLDAVAFCQSLAQYLWQPDKGFAGGVRNPPDQICHFSCHCDTTTSLAKDYALWLQSDRLFGRGKQKVTLESLTNALVLLGIANSADRRPRPLVFFNACGSGDMDPAGASSFPDLFLKKDLGFIGFVGTETTIPDEFAADFSKVFYEQLLAAVPIGRAIHAARWKLLRSNCNPLGILYSLYAEPEIRVRSPVVTAENALWRTAESDQPAFTEPTTGVWAFLRRHLGRRPGSQEVSKLSQAR